METIPQLNTWQGLFSLVILLIALYWLLKLIAYALKQFAKRNITNKKTIVAITKVLIVYKPIATLLILLDFIFINYIIHTIVLVIVGVFAYSQIKNYVNGIFLKLNPLINNGAIINVSQFSGEIKKLLPLGLILNTENGERFINYTTIESGGFAIKSNDNSLLRQTLYLETDKNEQQILDVLFDNPILNYEENPSVKATENNFFKLQYTLETGATTETLISFLENKNIKTTLTNNIAS